MPTPQMQIDILVLKQHASDSLIETLSALMPLKELISGLALLMDAQMELDADEEHALVQSGLNFHIRSIESGRHAEEANTLAGSILQGTHLLLTKAGDTLVATDSRFLRDIFTSLSPSVLTYFPVFLSHDQTPLAGTEDPTPHLVSRSPASACLWSGLFMPKVLFEAMGGFDIHYCVVPELDLWMRCYRNSPGLLKREVCIQVLAKKPVDDYLFRFGALGVFEKSNLYERLAGSARVEHFLGFAKDMSEAAIDRPWLKSTVADRLYALAYSILNLIDPVERHALLSHLQLTSLPGQVNPDFESIERAISRLPGRDNICPQNIFQSNIQVYSVGAYCQSAQVLKDLTVRSCGPFDWIFSSPQSIAHMLSDRFSRFCSADEIQVLKDEDKEDVNANKCDHRFYRDNFGVRYMFNHHIPDVTPDRDYFREVTQTFIRGLDDARPAVYLFVENPDRPSTGCLPIWEALQKYSGPKGLVSVKFKQVRLETLREEPITISIDPSYPILYLELPVASQSNGVRFVAELDNRRFRYLVFQALVWMLQSF